MQVNSTTGYRSRDLGGLASSVHFQLLLPALCHPWRCACTSAWRCCHVRGAWNHAHRHGINSKLGLGGQPSQDRGSNSWWQLKWHTYLCREIPRSPAIQTKQGCSSSTEHTVQSQKVKHLEKQHCLFWHYSTASAGTKSCPATGPELSLTTGRARKEESSQRAHTPRVTSFVPQFVPQFLFPTQCCVELATSDRWSILVKD